MTGSKRTSSSKAVRIEAKSAGSSKVYKAHQVGEGEKHQVGEADKKRTYAKTIKL